jgi:hypothetical protein
MVDDGLHHILPIFFMENFLATSVRWGYHPSLEGA